MSNFSITSSDFNEGGEIPKNCGYKHGNEKPELDFAFGETEPFPWAMGKAEVVVEVSDKRKLAKRKLF